MAAAAPLSPPAPRGFTKIVNAHLLNPRLTPEARVLLGIFEYHARGKGVCRLGYARICALLGTSEKTARARVRELEAAGLVHAERVGWTRVNRYYLTTPDMPSEGRGKPAPERESLSFPERESVPNIVEEEYREEKRAVPVDVSIGNSIRNVLKKPTLPASQRHAARLPAHDHDRAVIARHVRDFARELGDAAALPRSVSRATTLYRRSGCDLSEYLDHLRAAKETTWERSAKITKRDADGRPIRLPYAFSVLEQRLGLRTEVAIPRIASVEHKNAPVPGRAPGQGEEGERYVQEERNAPTLAEHEARLKYCQERREWPAELTAMSIRDLSAFIRVCGRGLFYDPVDSIAYARDRLGRRAAQR